MDKRVNRRSDSHMPGRLAQLVRALLSHGRGHRFEFCIAHFTKIDVWQRVTHIARIFASLQSGPCFAPGLTLVSPERLMKWNPAREIASIEFAETL